MSKCNFAGKIKSTRFLTATPETGNPVLDALSKLSALRREYPGIEALIDVVKSIDHDLNLQNFNIHPKSKKAAEKLAGELVQHLNDCIEAIPKNKTEDAKNSVLIGCYTKCAHSINKHRGWIEAEPTAFNQLKRVINKFLDLINQFTAENLPFIPLIPLAPVAKTEMNHHKDVKFRKSVGEYNSRMRLFPDTCTDVDPSLDTLELPDDVTSKRSK